MTSTPAHYPARVPIDAYGNGGFRFAEMSHRGSILIVPSGIYAWNVADMDEVDVDRCAPFLRELKSPAFVVLGTGTTQVMPDAAPLREGDPASIGRDAERAGSLGPVNGLGLGLSIVIRPKPHNARLYESLQCNQPSGILRYVAVWRYVHLGNGQSVAQTQE